MATLGNVQYVVDAKGRKKSVVISYAAYRELMEDLADLATKRERENEPPVDLEDALAETGKDV